MQASGGTKLPQAVAEIPWSQNVILVQRDKDPAKGSLPTVGEIEKEFVNGK